MSNTEAATVAAPRRSIQLPPIGTFIPHLAATFWAIQRANRGSGQDDYALLVPHGDDFEFVGPWGGYDHDEPGAACMWDGEANTIALLNSEIDHPAAKFCRNQDDGALASRLYLPSLRELKSLFANGCDAFNPDHVYWSSTQFSRYDAYCQYFGNGDTLSYGKDWKGGRSRPVRRSSLESLIP